MNASRHLPRHRAAAALAAAASIAALTVLGACSSSGSDDDHAGSTADTSAIEPADGRAGDRPAGGRADDGAADLDTGAAAAPEVASAAEDAPEAVDPAKDAGRVEPGTPAVIATGTVSLEAEDVAKARFDVRKVVDTHRGTITEQETTTSDEGEVATARLVVRVPSSSFAAAIGAFEEVGTLLASTTGGEDVTSEVIDIDARIRAQRKSVARIEALLARAENLQQVVSIESQLAGRQAELDSLVSRQKWLADQTTLSTITVAIEQPDEERADDEESEDGFLGGLRKGWDSFVDGSVVALTVVGFLLPWLVVLAVLGVPLWLVLRRRRAGHAATPAAPVTPPASGVS